MVFPGMVLDKERTIGAISDAPPWSEFNLTDLGVIEAGPDSAVVTYCATASRTGNRYRALTSTAYARRDGGWRLLLHQQTPDADGD